MIFALHLNANDYEGPLSLCITTCCIMGSAVSFPFPPQADYMCSAKWGWNAFIFQELLGIINHKVGAQTIMLTLYAGHICRYI